MNSTQRKISECKTITALDKIAAEIDEWRDIRERGKAKLLLALDRRRRELLCCCRKGPQGIHRNEDCPTHGKQVRQELTQRQRRQAFLSQCSNKEKR